MPGRLIRVDAKNPVIHLAIAEYDIVGELFVACSRHNRGRPDWCCEAGE
jgi:hypothetical protein